MVRQLAEEARVAVRNVRRHSKSDMEALEGEVSEDDVRGGESSLQEKTDGFIKKVDELLQHKESELLEV